MFEDLHRPGSSLLSTAGIDLMWKSSKPAHKSTSFMGRDGCFAIQSPVERTDCKYGCCLLRSWNILCPPEFLSEKFSGQVSTASAPSHLSEYPGYVFMSNFVIALRPWAGPSPQCAGDHKTIQIFDRYLTKDPLCTCPPWTNCILSMNISVTWFFSHKTHVYVSGVIILMYLKIFRCLPFFMYVYSIHKHTDLSQEDWLSIHPCMLPIAY